MATLRAALARRRAAVGHTQESLAELLRVERSTVGRWERGKAAPQPWIRPNLASALKVALDQLDELLRLDADRNVKPSPQQDAVASEVHDEFTSTSTGDGEVMCSQLGMLRQLVDVYDLPADGPVRPAAEFKRAVSAVVECRLNSDYSRLVELLPTLLPELTRGLFLFQGGEKNEIARLLVQAYRAADAIADKFGHYDLSARIIQVMRWAAEQSEDELTLAATAYVRTETFFAHGQLEAGRRMLEHAADQLRPGTSTRAAAAYGSLHMRAAVIAARAGRPDHARDHLSEARCTASGVDEGVYEGTAFGSGSVRIHEVTLALDLGAPDSALAAAAGWAPSARVPAERRSHFYVDVARARLSVGCHESVLDALDTARVIAPEHIRVHPQVRDILMGLAGGDDGDGSAARKFAAAAGIISVDPVSGCQQ